MTDVSKQSAETKDEKVRRQKRESYLRNRDKELARHKAYRATNKESRSEYARAYYLQNKVALNASSARYNAKIKHDRPWIKILQCARSRAKLRNICFALTAEWAESVWTGKCAITGLDFVVNETGETGPKPFSATVDRVIPSLGYTPGNCRFILSCVNNFRGTLGDDEMRRVAIAIAATT